MTLYGRVKRYFQDKGYGFICGEDGNKYFIHHSNLNGEYIDRGYYVFFKPFQNDRSDYNAENVMVIEAHQRGMNEMMVNKTEYVEKKETVKPVVIANL